MNLVTGCNHGDSPGLDFAALARRLRRPERFSGTDLLFWKDPYISEQALEAHLSPHSDSASRPPERIDEEVAFILDCLSSRRPAGTPKALRLLDIGCGPGLYSRRFASAGYRVVGLDAGPASHRYAVDAGGGPEYVLGDLEDGLPEGPFDAAVMIYGGFCTLSPSARRGLLQNLAAVLVPGGRFLFDAFTEFYLDESEDEPRYDLQPDGGFFSPKGHLSFEVEHRYDRQLACEQYLIVEDDGEIREFRTWHQAFDPVSAAACLGEAGFTVEGTYGDLTGAVYDPFASWFAIQARLRP